MHSGSRAFGLIFLTPLIDVAATGEVLADAELTVAELTAALIARVGPWAGELVMPAFQTL